MLGDLLGSHPSHLVTPETSYKAGLLTRWDWQGPRCDADSALHWLAQHPKMRHLRLPEGFDWTQLRHASYEELMLTLVESYGRTTGKEVFDVWIDHSPRNVDIGYTLLNEFAGSKFVHLVRDGRAVANSIVALDWGANSVIQAAHDWMRAVGFGIALEAAFPDRVFRVVYEELISDPERLIAEICKFAEIAFTDEMVRGGGLQLPMYTREQHRLVGGSPDPSRLFAWKDSMLPRQIEMFEAEVGNLLPLLGYERMYGNNPRKATRWTRLAMSVAHNARALSINRVRKGVRRHQDDRGI